MHNLRNIGVVFGIIIVLQVALGSSSLFYLNSIAKEAKNLYQHPYAVSNATRNVNINLISMHRYMKDVVLAEDEMQLHTAKEHVDQYEKKVQENFNIIFNRYLGSQKDIQTVYSAFLDWKAIRDEVIFLKTQGKDQKAAHITKNKGAQHVALLNQETQKLINFADNKANIFFNNAVKSKNNALTVITSLFIITVLSSIFIAFYSLKRLRKAQQEVKSRMYLIDQNILMATFDSDGVILDISSKLCRFLGAAKQDMIGKKSHFFTDIKNNDLQPKDILITASTGAPWEGDWCIKTQDGQLKWIHSLIHPELDENYNVCSYSNIIQDISDRKAIEELSITDPLTKLYNRRYFDQTLEKELRLAARNKSSVTLAIIDIDYFKKYNDCYGHPAGDQALIQIAQVFSQSLNRPNDYIFRLGGEEFGFIFSDFNREQTFLFLDHIRAKVELLNISHVDSDIAKSMTVSIGAHISSHDHRLDSNQLYIKADEALYQAKQKRNQVIITNQVKFEVMQSFI